MHPIHYIAPTISLTMIVVNLVMYYAERLPVNLVGAGLCLGVLVFLNAPLTISAYRKAKAGK